MTVSLADLRAASEPRSAPSDVALHARHRFADVADGLPLSHEAQALLTLLLTQDGSTTRLCEALAGAPVGLKVHHQFETLEVPPVVTQELPGRRFLQRCTSLVHDGEVLTDNISWVSMLALPPALRAQLVSAQIPIGHLLQKLWTRKRPLVHSPALLAPLWGTVGLADEAASRAYVITAPEGPCMVVVECFRRGLRTAGQGR
ncbi:MAG: hypothetical protein ACOVQT_07405 [Rubrivivax sp.]|jgi:chorismate-pyruvate lyase